jgi:hypothetical protein
MPDGSYCVLDYIGFETDAGYYETALERIAAHAVTVAAA